MSMSLGIASICLNCHLHSRVFHPLSASLMNLKPASRIAIRAVVKTVRAIWHA
jgi:hypothetical protein